MSKGFCIVTLAASSSPKIRSTTRKEGKMPESKCNDAVIGAPNPLQLQFPRPDCQVRRLAFASHA
ncbi:UNVERIFIED_ORG: hypothetical protein M2193_001848 [Bradyrhizobium japonicum]|jgi:hypothetical protein